MTDGLSDLRRQLVEVCRRLYARGLIAGADGNVSVRLGQDRLLVTPSGVAKGDLTEDDLIEISPTGEPRVAGRMPSREVAIHLRIYARRPDVMAVVHAHPPIATGFAVAGEPLPAAVLPELIVQMGTVPLIPYDTPGTLALAARFDPYLDSHDAFLMANHGAVTVGPSLAAAHHRMESVEHCARILLTAKLLGRVNELTPEHVAILLGGEAV